MSGTSLSRHIVRRTWGLGTIPGVFEAITNIGAGNIVLGVAIMSFALAACIYYFNLLDPAEAKEQFPGVYNFLANKWYFDAAYSALFVRPALVVAGWCRAFDTRVIDGAVDGTARVGVKAARESGRFDRGIVDGLVNVVGNTCWSVGGWLRHVQTGYLRSYVLFLVLAAISGCGGTTSKPIAQASR